MKRFYLILALALGFLTTATAQTEDKPTAPYTFVSVQGGMQNTYDTQFAFGRTWAPTGTISVGHFFNPHLGARVGVNGIWAKSNAPFKNAPTQQFDYNYVTGNADLLLNMVSIFTRSYYTPVNLYMIGGFGMNYAWNNDEALDLFNQGSLIEFADKDGKKAYNLRMGLQLEFNLCKNLALNLEADYNYLANGKTRKFVNDHNQFTAQAGLTFKFGYKKPKKEEVWTTRVDTVWFDDISYTPRVEDGTITWNVFYKIRESDFNDPDEQLKAIGNFLKDHRECKVSLKSYADVQTGNPKINMGYSQQRSEKAVKALVDAGVDPSIITAEYFGDTVQPFAENDKNRVTIITATGLKDVKDKVSVKKFRTKEVQYRVDQ